MEKKKKEKEEMKREKIKKKAKKQKQKTNTNAENTNWNPTRSSLDVPFVKKRSRRRVRMMKLVVFSASSFSSG